MQQEYQDSRDTLQDILSQEGDSVDKLLRISEYSKGLRRSISEKCNLNLDLNQFSLNKNIS